MLFSVAVAASAANVELALATPLSASLTEDACLHVQPSDDSELVMCLMTGAKLKLIARMKDKATSEGKQGYWYKAEFGEGQEGWVFSTKFKTCPEGCDPHGGAPSGKE